MRVVLDTNVLVAAMRSPRGASARVLGAVRSRRLIGVATTTLYVEWEAVLTRSEHVLAAGVTAADVRRALDELASAIEPISLHFSWRPVLSDPDDEMVFEAAVNGGAQAIVTFETSTFASAARQFGVEVLTPREIWARIAP